MIEFLYYQMFIEKENKKYEKCLLYLKILAHHKRYIYIVRNLPQKNNNIKKVIHHNFYLVKIIEKEKKKSSLYYNYSLEISINSSPTKNRY